MQAQNIKIDAFMKVYVTCHLREEEINEDALKMELSYE